MRKNPVTTKSPAEQVVKDIPDRQPNDCAQGAIFSCSLGFL